MKKIFHPWQTLLLLFILVVAASCQKQGAISPAKKEKHFYLGSFSKITAGENFAVSVIKSKTFSIAASGASDDLEDLGLSVQEGQLNIKYNRFRLNRGRVYFVISVPVLEVFRLNTGATGTIAGFQDQQSIMFVALSGMSSAILSGTGTRMSINVSGDAELSVSGNTDALQCVLSGSGLLHAYGLNVKDARVSAVENAKAYVLPTDVLFANVSGNGQVFYKGEPSMHLDINDNGQVIRE